MKTDHFFDYIDLSSEQAKQSIIGIIKQRFPNNNFFTLYA